MSGRAIPDIPVGLTGEGTHTKSHRDLQVSSAPLEKRVAILAGIVEINSNTTRIVIDDC
jgi:hypothetical protein